jgi:hypothetical protein
MYNINISYTNIRKHLKFVIAIKENFNGQDRYFKNTQSFPQREKARSVLRFPLLLAEEPCPLSLQTVFSIPILAYYFLITKF